MKHRDVHRHTRQFASQHDLNMNDGANANITSYSTRVELLRKTHNGTKWTMTLRKLERLPHSKQLRIDWWSEDFDAVVVATNKFDSPYIPRIPGIVGWGQKFKDQLYHSRSYRRPESAAGKVCVRVVVSPVCDLKCVFTTLQKVLIIGGSASSTGIAQDLAPHAADFAISMRVRL